MKINTKFLISILVILLLLCLINQYTRIIENNENENEAEGDKEKVAESLNIINNIKT
tara:strand:- start:5269 stop:5439 length:171 start_codon:yes stop_codon:yes gene_type:complete